jgi:hypothetical protein
VPPSSGMSCLLVLAAGQKVLGRADDAHSDCFAESFNILFTSKAYPQVLRLICSPWVFQPKFCTKYFFPMRATCPEFASVLV